MFVRVEITCPGQAAKQSDLTGPQIALGRDPAAQLPFDGKANSAVSWQHARIDLAGGGATIADLGSSNGTFVNDERIAGTKTIRPGDVISLGQTGPKIRILEISTAPLQKTVAEKMLPKGMLTPPAGSVPLNVSIESSGLSRPANKRRRSSMGGIVLCLLAVGAVAAAGFVVFNSRPEKKDEQVAEKKDDKKDEPKADGSETTDPKLAALKKPPVEIIKAPDPAPIPPPPITATGVDIYRRTLQSTGWVTVPRSPISMSTGTGALVDAENRLFLTAYHVVEGSPEARIYFPKTDIKGKTISVRNYYLDNERPVIGEVIVADPKRDLAVLRLRSIPASLAPLPPAKEGADIAERVYTVGNPAVSGALWVYTEGTIRQVVQKKIRLDNKQDVDAWTLEAQFPINPGDSGGPVVNDKKELVGVNSSFNAKAQSMSNIIDLREIRVVIEQAKRVPTLKLP